MKVHVHALIVALGLVLILPGTGSARVDYDEGRYSATDKLVRGLAGMTTGFLELPGNIVAENREHGAATAATIGFAKGLGMIPVRELVGVFDFVTAPFEVPDDYNPILHPEYPWQYFEGAPPAQIDRRAEG